MALKHHDKIVKDRRYRRQSRMALLVNGEYERAVRKMLSTPPFHRFWMRCALCGVCVCLSMSMPCVRHASDSLRVPHEECFEEYYSFCENVWSLSFAKPNGAQAIPNVSRLNTRYIPVCCYPCKGSTVLCDDSSETIIEISEKFMLAWKLTGTRRKIVQLQSSVCHAHVP